MSKKMCDYYFTTSVNGGEIRNQCNKVYGENCNIDGVVTCPKNTNSRCEIITKPKPRMVRVKAWAYVKDGGYTWDGKPVLCGATVFRGDKYLIPCTILIDRKYLTTKKGCRI